MSIKIIGEHPLACDSGGNLRSRIATVFLNDRVLVTLPGIHATQRLAYSEVLNAERKEAGKPPLTVEEEQREWDSSADVIMENGYLLIRPDPARMNLAFAADEILQELVSKRRILFLSVQDDRVRQAITERGELWRIAALPQSPDEMKAMIHKSRIRIAHHPLYYYNMITGERLVTFDAFDRLHKLPDSELAGQLKEIAHFCARTNRRGYPEVCFFMTGAAFGPSNFAGGDFDSENPAALRACYERLRTEFMNAVPPQFRIDDPNAAEWRMAMFTALIQRRDEPVADAILRGLSPEFFLQIQWLPGGRIEQGEMVLDPVFEELESNPDDAELKALCNENAKQFFFNFIRDFGEVQHINIGRIVTSLSTRPAAGGRRDVYIAEIKIRERDQPLVRIIRLMKWDVREHLEENKNLLQAILEADEYTEYILNRRMGCRQLGMNLPSRISTHKIREIYHGTRREYEGQALWATYFERDYVRGVATDKIPPARMTDAEFSVRFASLLGRAAAPNIIVGRLHLNGRILFDDGDEVLVEDEHGLPVDIAVTDHTGTFVDYRSELAVFAEGYADPVNRRLAMVPQPFDFVNAYLAAFQDRFDHIRSEVRKHRRAFLSMFRHSPGEKEGSFSFRWERVLERLDRTDSVALVEAIRSHIKPH